jgi:GDP-L-fucose synthase
MKTALITGCSGLVGTFLVQEIIKNKDYNKIIGIDLKPFNNKLDNQFKNKFCFEQVDLTIENNLIDLFDKYSPDVVVNAFGIKGSPIRAKESPVDFLYPSFKINTEIINQCYKRDIYLVFMSSVGVYAPAEKFIEGDVWKTLPSQNDWFPSWSKRMGELLLEAYKVQYGYDKWSIIRPANIFGDYDDFSGNGTVISSTIKKIWESEGTLECWGDGSPTRDFVYGKDVANAILKLIKSQINDIVNFGSGEEITIKSMIESLVKISGKNLVINWDVTKPNGDMRRQMDVSKQKELDLLPEISFNAALKDTYEYYISQFPKEGLNFKIKDFINDGFYVGNTNEIFDDMNQFYVNIDKVIENSKDKSHYLYRFDYKLPDIGKEKYDESITKDKILERENYIKEKNGFVTQRWWEIVKFNEELKNVKEYMEKKVAEYVTKIYPELKNNILHQNAFTIYENGDFIEEHMDGYNHGRKCVVLVYLSYKKDYINGGGELVIKENGIEKIVEPFNENFTILDFTKNNPNHSVTPVKNDFVRFTYIDFIYNKKEVENKTII